jgi:hypothetical protein
LFSSSLCAPFPRAHIFISQLPHALFGLSGFFLSRPEWRQIHSPRRLTSVDLSQTRLDHFKIDVLPVQEDHPQDSIVAILAIALDINSLIQYQPSQVFGRLPALRLPWFVFVMGALRGIYSDQPYLDRDVMADGYE